MVIESIDSDQYLDDQIFEKIDVRKVVKERKKQIYLD
jgi:hypothetical protein